MTEPTDTPYILSWLKNNDLPKSVTWSKSIPEDLSSPPWRVPDTVERAEDINAILEHSIKVQASTVQTRVYSADDLQMLELRYYVLSNESLAVTGFLAR